MPVYYGDVVSQFIRNNPGKRTAFQANDISYKFKGEGRAQFENDKSKYHNETVADIVTNKNEQHRIIESDGQLIQKIFPIFKEPGPRHLLDYRTQFYVPEKFFLGFSFDTVKFNLAAIGLMTILLIVSL